MLINCRGPCRETTARRINSARGGITFRPDTIFEVLPKREALFATRLFETGEGVATASPRRTAGAGIDLALLDPVAQVIFATVIV